MRRTRTVASINERIRRRELRATRSGLSVSVGIIAVILLGYLALEAGTRAVGHDPWWVAPDKGWAWFVDLPHSAAAPLGVAVLGVLIVAVGCGLVLAAVLPGGRRRRAVDSERVVAMIDDDVVAQALVRAAYLSAGVGSAQVRVGLERDQVLVTVRPTSGVATDADRVRQAVADEIERQGLPADLEVSVNVAATGVVGQ